MVTRVIYFILSFMDMNEWLSFLTFAFLPIDEITSVKKETLQISESSAKISFLRRFCIFVGILLDSVDLFESREDMKFIISYLSVEIRIMRSIFKKIRKVLMGMLNTFFSPRSYGS